MIEIFTTQKCLIPSLQKCIPATSHQRLKEPEIRIAADTQKAITLNHCDRSWFALAISVKKHGIGTKLTISQVK